MLGCWVINDNKLGISGNLYFPTGGSLAQDIPVMGFLYLKMACSSSPPRETKYEPCHATTTYHIRPRGSWKAGTITRQGGEVDD